MVQGFFLRICRVDAIIEQVGAHVRYLPPYSTDFNPIELAFAKLKAFLRVGEPLGNETRVTEVPPTVTRVSRNNNLLYSR